MDDNRQNNGDYRPELDDEEYSLPLSALRERERTAGDQISRPPGADQSPPPPPPPQYRELPPDDGLSLRALTEAAMMVAISLVLAVISTYVPVLSMIGLLLYPLPTTVLTLRRGLKTGITGVVALFALSSLLLGLPQAVMMLIQYGALGLFLGYCFRARRKPLFTLGIAVVIAALGSLAGLMLALYISGLPVEALAQQVEQVIDQYIAVLGASGGLPPSGYTLAEFRDFLLNTMSRLLPAILIIAGMMMTAICYFITAKVLRHLRYDIPPIPRFANWRMDWRFSWGVILGLLCLLAGHQLDIGWLSTLGQNILYCFAPVLIVCGGAFIAWYLRFLPAGPVLKTVTVIMLVLFINYFAVFLMLLAVFDPLLDLRGRLTRTRERLSR